MHSERMNTIYMNMLNAWQVCLRGSPRVCCVTERSAGCFIDPLTFVMRAARYLKHQFFDARTLRPTLQTYYRLQEVIAFPKLAAFLLWRCAHAVSATARTRLHTS